MNWFKNLFQKVRKKVSYLFNVGKLYMGFLKRVRESAGSLSGFINSHIGFSKRIKRVLLILLGLFILGNLWLFFIFGPLRAFFWDYPKLAGITSLNQNYLILFQNNAEIRPTGGFISSYGVLRMTLGIPTKLQIRDSYSLDTSSKLRVSAPHPIEAIFSEDKAYRGWVFRDANFSPDFPISVEQILKFYSYYDSDIEFDGVIAVDLEFLSDLLEVFSPVEVEDVEFTPDNLFTKLEFAVKNVDKHDEEALESRKSILSSFGKKLVWKSVFSPFSHREIFRVIYKNLLEKHVLFWFRDDDLQNKVLGFNFAGEWKGESGEFGFGVNFANLGGKKSDRYIRREVETELDLMDDGSVEGRTRVKLIHMGEENYQSGRYRGYMRTYFPWSTKFIRFSGDFGNEGVDVYKELGFNAAGSFISLDPGNEAVYKYYFRLPPNSWNGRKVRVNVLKQPGTDSDFYRLTLKTPPGTIISGDGFVSRENRAFAELFLDRNYLFTAKVLEDNDAPIVVDQKMFGDLSQVLIIFSEEMDAESVLDIQNYKLSDRDFLDSKTTDDIQILSASYFDRGLKLEISGMTVQVDERYYLTMDGLSDVNGNSLSPNPHRVTVVQRVE